MSKYVCTGSKLTAIGDAIRAKTGGTDTLTLDQMASAIGDLHTSAQLTFSTVRGTVPDTEDAHFAVPTAPSATGYGFVGWYADADLTTAYDWDAAAATSTAYGKWSINAPTVSHPDIVIDGTTEYTLGTVTAKGDGQTVEYSADGTTWQATCPKASAEGTYTTYWRITATDCDELTGSFTTALIAVPDWSTGSDTAILNAIKKAQAGTVNLADYWSVGDTRKVTLSAMSATGVGESHVAQTVEVVLMDFQQLYDYADGSGKCKVIWGLKDGLANGTTGEYGYMNSSNTNTGGWNSTARRTWCNNVFYAALPAWMRTATKQVNVVTASGSSSSTTTSTDYCFLPAEKEIFGSNTYANSTAETNLKQWTWYATSDNRIKHCGPSGSAYRWWERSSVSGVSGCFCFVGSDGSANNNNASNGFLLAPCGCF